MAAVNANHDEWQCTRCTLLNNSGNTQCILCGELRINETKTKDNYGSIIYRVEPFTLNELDAINRLYTKNPSKKHGKYPIILYPNNDINYKRDKSSDIALLSSTKHNKEYTAQLLAKYDRQFCYGIVVQFHAQLLNYYKKIEILPIFHDFTQIIDKQFNYLCTHYIRNGHDIIIPSPNKHEIATNIDKYHTNKMHKNKQTIFHTLGTYNNGLPASYYTYIQQKINEINAKNVIYPIRDIIKSELFETKNDIITCELSVMKHEIIKSELFLEAKDDEKELFLEYGNDLYEDEDDEKEINMNDISFCKNDAIEVFNVNKNVWIRGVFVGEYVDDKDCMQYFVEISDDGSDSSLDYDDKILKKESNVEKKDIIDIIKKTDKKKKTNNRKKGVFYCSKKLCDGNIYIKSKRKRANKTSFKCTECKSKNCIDCNVIHRQIKEKKIRRLDCEEYQFLYQNKFLNRWKKFKINKSLNPYKTLKKYSKMKKIYKVKRGGKEWNEVITNMQTMNQFNVTSVERVQNSKLYIEYYRHCKEMILKRKMKVNELRVWHGTRQTDPCVIWKGSGFDVRYANVGGCIWFAIQNNYSMGGYQFRKNNLENQVFLAFVASGDSQSVKFIRNGQILNVYKNQTMYPAYVVTYQNGAQQW